MKTYIYLSILGLTILASCSIKTQDTDEETVTVVSEKDTETVHFTDEQLQQVAIQTSKLTEIELSKSITVNGMMRLKPENEMEVSSLIDGQFKNSKVTEGSFVTKGQILGQLDNLQIIDMQEQYLVAKAKYQLAKADFERQTELNKTQSASNKVVQQAKFEFNQQAILVQTLDSKLNILGINTHNLSEKNIQRTVYIRAPFTGYIDKVMATNGTYVTSNEPLFKIINANDLLLQLKVYQDDLPFLKTGQIVIAFTNNDKIEREGKIITINTQLTPEGYGEVICNIQNQEQLIPGMYMNAKIELAHHKVYAVPVAAVIMHNNKQYVYVRENNNIFKEVEVVTGVEEKGFIEIKNATDLQNKLIVVNDAYAILMHSKNIDEDDE